MMGNLRSSGYRTTTRCDHKWPIDPDGPILFHYWFYHPSKASSPDGRESQFMGDDSPPHQDSVGIRWHKLLSNNHPMADGFRRSQAIPEIAEQIISVMGKDANFAAGSGPG